MLCPSCKQGTVAQVRINATGEIVHLCAECEELWPSGMAISESGFISFVSYMSRLGLQGRWSEVIILKEDA
jgi:hypothetical protein